MTDIIPYKRGSNGLGDPIDSAVSQGGITINVRADVEELQQRQVRQSRGESLYGGPVDADNAYSVFKGDLLFSMLGDNRATDDMQPEPRVFATFNGMGNAKDSLRSNAQKMFFQGIAGGQGYTHNESMPSRQSAIAFPAKMRGVFTEGRLLCSKAVGIGKFLMWNPPPLNNPFKCSPPGFQRALAEWDIYDPSDHTLNVTNAADALEDLASPTKSQEMKQSLVADLTAEAAKRLFEGMLKAHFAATVALQKHSKNPLSDAELQGLYYQISKGQLREVLRKAWFPTLKTPLIYETEPDPQTGKKMVMPQTTGMRNVYTSQTTAVADILTGANHIQAEAMSRIFGMTLSAANPGDPVDIMITTST